MAADPAVTSRHASGRQPAQDGQTAVIEVSPPSMVKVVPVMNDASSDSRNLMGRAISSGAETRLSGVRSSSCWRNPGSSNAGAYIGVATAPGHTALTRNPSMA